MVVAEPESKGKRKARGEAGGGAKKGKRSHMASPVPGGPVAGADVRMDRWPPATDADGRPLQEQVNYTDLPLCMQALHALLMWCM